MELIAKIALIGLVVSVMLQYVKQVKQELAPIIVIAVSVLVLGIIVTHIVKVIQVAMSLVGELNMQIPFIDVLFKIIGVAYIAEYSAQICRDMGEGAIAMKIQTAGKVLMAVLSTQVLVGILQILLDIIRMV